MTYTVKKGDTLSEIALQYGTTVGALTALNGIQNPHNIKVGQVLLLKANKPQGNNAIYNAFITCLDAIENLPEFKTLSGLLEED